MTAQEVELRVIEIVTAVLSGQPVEDSKVELKSSWLDPRKAADRLAAHANAARGVPILWVIGVDENNKRLASVDTSELASWYKAVEQFFDGFAPRLVDVNVRVKNDTVVGLYFETEHGAPYVVKNSTGGYPQFIVPWREGTGLRAARREDLLRILVPIRRLSALIDELEFNLAIVHNTKTIDSLGARFREDELQKALGEGVLSTLPDELRRLVTEAYVATSRANQLVNGAFNSSPLMGARQQQTNQAWQAVNGCGGSIRAAVAALSRFLK